MQTVQITTEMSAAIASVLAEGKTPWVAVKDGAVIEVYVSRANARAAKDAGKIMKASEVETAAPVMGDYAAHEYEVPAEAKQGDAVANAAETPKTKAKALLPNFMEILQQTGACPYCGDTDNGCTYDDEPGHETDYLYCHVCDTSFHSLTGALRRASKKIEITRHSTIDRPCKQVWHIADEMAEKVGGFKNLRRKDVLAHCVASGIAFYTARTQYQLWLTIQNGGSI